MSTSVPGETHDVKIGQVYSNLKPPRYNGRVQDERKGLYELVRVDKPSVSRVHDAEKLCDPLNYERVA